MIETLTDWWRRVSTLEPARVRAVWASLVGLAVALGVTVSTDLDTAVQAVIVAVFTLLPLLQGESTRAKVTPTATVDELMHTPDDPDTPVGDL